MTRTENNCFQLFDEAWDEMKCFLLFLVCQLQRWQCVSTKAVKIIKKKKKRAPWDVHTFRILLSLHHHYRRPNASPLPHITKEAHAVTPNAWLRKHNIMYLRLDYTSVIFCITVYHSNVNVHCCWLKNTKQNKGSLFLLCDIWKKRNQIPVMFLFTMTHPAFIC